MKAVDRLSRNSRLGLLKWFSKAYSIASEPCTGYPGASEQLGRGTIRKLQEGKTLEASLTATIFTGIEKVKAANTD